MKTTWFAAAAALFLAHAAVAQEIQQVTVHGDRLLITGTQLGGRLPTVRLGSTALKVLTVSQTQVAAQLPPNLAAGTYALVLTRFGSGKTSFAVSIGDIGPQGADGHSIQPSTTPVQPNECASGSGRAYEIVDGRGLVIAGSRTVICDGEAGANGRDGTNGRDGKDGTNGTNGQDGAPGTNGLNGKDGAPGLNGLNGTSCTIADNLNGTATLACGSSTVLVTTGRGEFSPVVGYNFACFIRASDRLTQCFGGLTLSGPLATTPVIQLSAGYSNVCGVTNTHQILCNDSSGSAFQGMYSQVAAPPYYADTATCALALDGSIACTGYAGTVNAVPSGSFKQVAVGYGHACALRTDGAITCWGSDPHAPSMGPPPSGTFTAISLGEFAACALGAGGDIQCWQGLGPPTGQFVQVAAGLAGVCGIKTDGTIACNGSIYDGSVGTYVPLTPPAGTYTSLSVGRNSMCAVSTTGAMACSPSTAYSVPALP
ncbi:MAG: hypothetical protein JST92_18460 [Deltaproteobacteria bacterium]|nr:hypothetical protein [Deltaproteobacteria bacterium]